MKRPKGTKSVGVWLVVLVTFLTAGAQILLKLASAELELTAQGVLLNGYLWAGGILYVISAVLLLLSFRKGELSTLYPILALSYVWVIALSSIIFGEALRWNIITGAAVIIIGVSMLGAGK